MVKIAKYGLIKYGEAGTFLIPLNFVDGSTAVIAFDGASPTIVNPHFHSTGPSGQVDDLIITGSFGPGTRYEGGSLKVWREGTITITNGGAVPVTEITYIMDESYNHISNMLTENALKITATATAIGFNLTTNSLENTGLNQRLVAKETFLNLYADKIVAAVSQTTIDTSLGAYTISVVDTKITAMAGSLTTALTSTMTTMLGGYTNTLSMQTLITASANGVKTFVSQTYTTKSAFDDKFDINNSESYVSQTALAIESRVQTNGVISAINQTAEEIKIQAAKIALEGIVTANSKFKILLDGSMEATGGLFKGKLQTTEDAEIGQSLQMPVYTPMTVTEANNICNNGSKGIKFGVSANKKAFLTAVDLQYLVYGTVGVAAYERIRVALYGSDSVWLTSGGPMSISGTSVNISSSSAPQANGSVIITQSALALGVTALTFTGTLSNSGAPDLPVSYYKDVSGIVHLEGTATCSLGMSIGGLLATLPGGYHPLGTIKCSCYSNVTGGYVGISINSSGQILLLTALPTGGWLSFDSVQFRTI